MEYDRDKVDEMVLALLYLTSSRDQFNVTRAWKGLEWGTLNRLYEKGYLKDQNQKLPTVVLTEEGARLSKELFFEYFEAKE